MLIRKIIIFTLLICGCYAAPSDSVDLTEEDLEIIDKVKIQWSIQVPELIGDKCEKDINNTKVLIVYDYERYVDLTWTCPPTPDMTCIESVEEGICDLRFPSCTWAVFQTYNEGVWPRAVIKRDLPLIIIWHEANIEFSKLHEYMHLFERCTGRGYNYRHDDEAVWGPNGVHRIVKRQIRNMEAD